MQRLAAYVGIGLCWANITDLFRYLLQNVPNMVFQIVLRFNPILSQFQFSSSNFNAGNGKGWVGPKLGLAYTPDFKPPKFAFGDNLGLLMPNMSALAVFPAMRRV